MEAKPTVVFPFFGAFSSGRIPKTTKDINVHFFIHTFAEIFLMQRILQILPAYSGNFLQLLLLL